MEDLISRQAATSIPILPKEHRKVFRDEDDAFETGWNEALACVNRLPSAHPEPKTGKWIRHDEVRNVYGGTYVECSECGEKYVVQYIEDEKYCRNCGADMRGEQNE